MTYTLATMQVSKRTFEEIKAQLLEAGYSHATDSEGLDMTHVLLQPQESPKRLRRLPRFAYNSCALLGWAIKTGRITRQDFEEFQKDRQVFPLEEKNDIRVQILRETMRECLRQYAVLHVSSTSRVEWAERDKREKANLVEVFKQNFFALQATPRKRKLPLP